MFVKPITYTDYDGVERTEKFYFNLNKAEIIEMDATETGGLDRKLREMVELKDTSEIFKRMKFIILSAYGKKSADGRQFIKSPELSKEFEQTEAYSNLIIEFMSNPDSFNDFLRKTIPQGKPSSESALTVSSPSN